MNPNARRRLIDRDRSILIHSDSRDMKGFLRTVNDTNDLSEVGGYIIDTSLTYRYGLERMVGAAKYNTEKPIICMARAHAEDSDKFAYVCGEARVDGVILKACDDYGISFTAYSLMESGTTVIADCVGGGVHHDPKKMAHDVSEAYSDASVNGIIRDFVVPLRLMDAKAFKAWNDAVNSSGKVDRENVYYADARDALSHYNYAREFKGSGQWHIIISDANIGGKSIREIVNNCVMAIGGLGSMDTVDIESCLGKGSGPMDRGTLPKAERE